MTRRGREKKKVNCGFAGKIASGEQPWSRHRGQQHYMYMYGVQYTDTSDYGNTIVILVLVILLYYCQLSDRSSAAQLIVHVL